MHAQGQSAGAHPSKPHAIRPTGPGAAALRSDPACPKEALLWAARLIQEAGKMLWSDPSRAQSCMQEAIGLLTGKRPAAIGTQGHRESNICLLAPWQIARALTFVDENLAEKIALQQLADATRLSTSHFSRAFRITRGESPYTFITLRRIGRARDLLLTTDMPLSEVALECGLAD